MMTDIDKYLIPLSGYDLCKILEEWKWLTGDKTIVALTKTGDLLLKDKSEHLYFLDAGGGTLSHKADNYLDFINQKLSDELTEELLLPHVIDKLQQQGTMLKPGQVYSYTLLPILGGNYDDKNRFAVDLYEHFSLTGATHFQIKDLPDESSVEIITSK